MTEIVQNLGTSLTGYSGVFSGIFFVIARSLTIIIPPIPGGLVDLVGISIFGWVKSLMLAEAGIILGASTAFFIARYFREPLLRRFTSVQKIHQWEKELSKKEQFWSWVALRLPSNLFFDYISYAAGLTSCSYRMFISSTIVGNFPSVFLFYIVSGYAYKHGGALQAVIAAVALFVLGQIAFRIYRKNIGKKIN